jgi:superfamily II DNA or RNA helicase
MMSSTVENPPKFKRGDAVQRTNQPDAVGLILEERWDSQTLSWKYVVLFGRDRRAVPEDAIRAVVLPDSPWDALRQNSVSGIEHFIFTVTYHRLRHPPARIAHSFATARTQFYPHQFKPLLKFLDNPGKRLLIADDVGLGKTIEAGYILRELDAVQGRLERVLIVVPARLAPKWKREMQDRFNEAFDIISSNDLLRQADRLRRNQEVEPFRAITSYERVRGSEIHDALEETQLPIDLLIADEAHRMRNPESLQHKVGQILCGCSDTVLFLSATPLQTSLENLWHLLRLLSPEEFSQWPLFDEQMRANRFLLQAQRYLAAKLPDIRGAESAFQQFLDTRVGKAASETEFVALLKERLSADELDRHSAVEVQGDIGRMSPIGHLVSRTRKVEALPNRPVRVPWWVPVPLEPPEREIYENVEQLCRAVWGGESQSWGFQMSLLMAYRITASCIPAAMRYFRDKLRESQALIPTAQYEPDANDEDDDGQSGEEVTAWTSRDTREALERILTAYEQAALPDSKLRQLTTALEAIWKEDDDAGRPRRKVVLFSFFRRTLEYLASVLRARGIENRMIHGQIPVDERERAIDDFLELNNVRLLLTSEVGGEGIDLQRASVIVNYDLPWNPMVVEQRIGRIDRIGQEAQRILILNFAVKDSIEERILQRLLTRIEVFKESIGELDDIIGNQIEEITTRALRGELLGDELEKVVNQTGEALEHRIQEARTMLARVDGLLAADQALVNEINAVVGERQLPSENELLLFLNKFLAERYPGSQLPVETKKTVVDVQLGGDLIADMELHASEVGDDATHFARRARGIVPLTLSREAAYRHHRAMLVHLQHPLSKFAVQQVDGAEAARSAAFAIRLRSSVLRPGIYAFLLSLLHINSFRPTTKFAAVFSGMEDGNILVDPSATTQLLLDILDHGCDVAPPQLGQEQFDALQSRLEGAIESVKRDVDAHERKLDLARRLQQQTSQRVAIEFRVRQAREKLANLEAKGARDFAVRMARHQLNKVVREQETFEKQELPTTWGGVEHEEIAVGLLVVEEEE